MIFQFQGLDIGHRYIKFLLDSLSSILNPLPRHPSIFGFSLNFFHIIIKYIMMSPEDAKTISRDLPICTATVAKGSEFADSSLNASDEVTETPVTEAASQDIPTPIEATVNLKSKTRYSGPATMKEEVTLQQIADKLKTRRYKGPKGKRGQVCIRTKKNN